MQWVISTAVVLAATACSALGGDLQVDGRWIEFRGQKVLLIGDSITQGWMELGENFNQTAYIDALAARGINSLMLWCYIGGANQVADSRIGYDAPEIWPWQRSGSTFNLTQFNPAYFSRLETLIEYADTKNIVVGMTIHDGWTKTRFSGHPFNQSNGGPLSDRSQYVELHDYSNEMPTTFDPNWTRRQKNQFFQERLVDRLIQSTDRFPNFMLEVMNEGEWYNQTDLRAYTEHFLRFIRARTTRNLTMVNDDHVGGTSFRVDAKCDIISHHKPLWDTGTSALQMFNHYASEFAKTPVKPVFFGEPVPEYQGNAAEHDALMRIMWGTAVGGAGFLVQNDASWGFDPNTNMAAQSINRDIVLDREGHCARFFNRSGLVLGSMVPNGALASTGVCLATVGSEYVVYAQSGASFTVNLNAAAGKTLNCRFYNPRTGVFGATFQRTGGSSSETFVKPGSSDWVLHAVIQAGDPVAVIATSPDPAEGFVPLTVSFDASGSHDPDGTIISYEWDFDGDGVYDANNPSPLAGHAYTTPGTFTCRLRVTDNDGQTGEATATVKVRSVPGDFDGDADVDLEDFAHLQLCYTALDTLEVEIGCMNADLNGDGFVGLGDFAIFYACMSGPGVPAATDCAN